MKRILAIGMMLLLLFSMAGCGKKKEKTAAQAATVVHAEEKQETSVILENDSEQPTEKEPKKQEEKKQEAEEKVSELVEQLLPTPQPPAEQPEKKPEEQVNSLLLRNTELEQKLVGTWYETIDFGELMSASMGIQYEPGLYMLEASYTYQNGKMSMYLNEDQMRVAMRALFLDVFTKAAEENGITLEEAGVTDEAIEQSVDASIRLMNSAMRSMEYAVYDGNILWHGGIREGELVEVSDNRVVVQHDDGRQTIMTRGPGREIE